MADERGLSSLTLSALATRLGVRQPSLYKHIESLDGLQRSISIQARRELGQVLAGAAVGRSGPEAVRSLAVAYRHWVLEHPGRYAATVRAPDPDDEEDLRASDDVVATVVAVLAAFELAGEAAIDAARALRSAIHGFVSLETGGGFGLPRDLTTSFDFLVETLVRGLGEDAPAG
ncbi:TetR-like C-terminal domain-containing protein [Nocardioides sp.]|uniref:TetR-like C-terminal domain-containing protein n=1 Tax=Nocardioides sp. TaxID=35761 RepID=UPI00352826DF